jgi:protein-disulfide isomerase
MEKRKFLVLSLFLSCLLTLFFLEVRQLRSPKPIAIDTAGIPSAGSREARVEIVVFEDFQCSTCRHFSEEVFPQLQKKYIEPGIARYTIVSLALIPGSKLLSNAALGVYHSSPDRYFAFIHEIFNEFAEEEKAVTEEKLLEAAKKVGGIDMAKIESCIKSRCYYPEIDRNLELARSVMKKNFHTPTVFINGIQATALTWKSVEAQIEKALQ